MAKSKKGGGHASPRCRLVESPTCRGECGQETCAGLGTWSLMLCWEKAKYFASAQCFEPEDSLGQPPSTVPPKKTHTHTQIPNNKQQTKRKKKKVKGKETCSHQVLSAWDEILQTLMERQHSNPNPLGLFSCFSQNKAVLRELQFLLCSGNETFMCFVRSAVCQCECFITRLAPARAWAQLSSERPLLSPLGLPLPNSTPCYRQHRRYAEVLKGRMNLLICFAAFWTPFSLFPVNEIQSLCDSRDTRSLAVLQQRLGMETWSHKYGLEPHCQGHSTFPVQNDTPGKSI